MCASHCQILMTLRFYHLFSRGNYITGAWTWLWSLWIERAMGSSAIHSGLGKMWWFWWDVSFKKTSPQLKLNRWWFNPVTGKDRNRICSTRIDICNQDWWCQLEYFQGSRIHSQSAAQWCQHPAACSVWLQTQRLVIGDILGNNPQRDIQCLHGELYGFRIAFMSSWMPDLKLIAAIEMLLHVHKIS